MSANMVEIFKHNPTFANIRMLLCMINQIRCNVNVLIGVILFLVMAWHEWSYDRIKNKDGHWKRKGWINEWIKELEKFLHDRPWISPWIKSISKELDITCHVFTSQLSCHCYVIANRLWRHQQNVGRASEWYANDMREWYAKILVFSLIYGFVMSCKKWNNICTLVTNCLCAHSSVILVLISLVAAQLGK